MSCCVQRLSVSGLDTRTRLWPIQLKRSGGPTWIMRSFCTAVTQSRTRLHISCSVQTEGDWGGGMGGGGVFWIEQFIWEWNVFRFDSLSCEWPLFQIWATVPTLFSFFRNQRARIPLFSDEPSQSARATQRTSVNWLGLPRRSRHVCSCIYSYSILTVWWTQSRWHRASSFHAENSLERNWHSLNCSRN